MLFCVELHHRKSRPWKQNLERPTKWVLEILVSLISYNSIHENMLTVVVLQKIQALEAALEEAKIVSPKT